MGTGSNLGTSDILRFFPRFKIQSSIKRNLICQDAFTYLTEILGQFCIKDNSL